MHIGLDNVFVSPENGHLWVAHFINGLQFFDYIHNHSMPSPGRILHVAVDEKSKLPFDSVKIEDVLTTSGERISAVSMGLYFRGKLLVGTVRKDMLICDVPYLMYT